MRLRQLCTVLLVAVALGPHAASAAEPSGGEKRIALVIGNADYAAGRLANSVLDARSMAETLRELGFEVLAHENAGYREMRRAMAAFGERLARDAVGLFYYAGHGLQVNGKNYLVPTDAEIKSERYVAAEALEAEGVLAQMQEAQTRVNIVILDACRDNPFTTRFRGLTRGLAFMAAPAGTYMAYATAPGSVAEDGEPGGGQRERDEQSGAQGSKSHGSSSDGGTARNGWRDGVTATLADRARAGQPWRAAVRSRSLQPPPRALTSSTAAAMRRPAISTAIRWLASAVAWATTTSR